MGYNFPQPISEQIWADKYRLVTNKPDIKNDEDVIDTWSRIARACADSPVKMFMNKKGKVDVEARFKRFFDVLGNFKFLPAGRITAGAGSGRNVTLFNCLAGSTSILTMEYGLIPIEQIAGQNVHILDGNGNWTVSMINSFDPQPVRTIVFTGGYNSRQSYSVDTTDNHRWLLEDGTEVTTDNLLTNMKLKTVIRKDVLHSDDYISGVQHGIIYGDGSKDYGSKYRIHLCADKNSLSSFFSTWVKTTPPSLGGESIYFGTNGKDMKALPSGETVEYMTGFLRGWFATDGCVDTRDGKPSLACGESEVTWLKQFGAIAGMEVAYSSKLASTTNYGQRNKEIFNVSFHKWTMIPEDFLMEHHLLNFKPSPMVWKVDSVFGLNDPEPVYCPSVPTTGSFQLGKGVHTQNCYVMGTIQDSLYSIFENLKEAALTMQQGGGIGYDFSPLRPKNAPVKHLDADASGPLTFMDVWDMMCKTIMSAGSRRGAMMATMICTHPDIIRFITAKHDPLKLRMFNVSVMCTDDFMTAVREDAEWILKHKSPPAKPLAIDGAFHDADGNHYYEVVQAKDIWNLIMQNTYDHAEPGVLFIDRINKRNNLWYYEYISSTNPCGEQPLPPYGACLLGSLNLTQFVLNPFTTQAQINWPALEQATRDAVNMLDAVIDISNFPLEAQREEATSKRRMGIGITGFGDMLAMLCVAYGSEMSIEVADQVMQQITFAAYDESADLAGKFGPCIPTTTVEQRTMYLEGYLPSQLPEPTKKKILKWGIRNSHLISIAPTGTISLYAGNISSGCEPIFAYEYFRKVLEKDGTKREEPVIDYAVKLYRDMFPDSTLPEYFVNAQTLTPRAHLEIQATLQKWVDSSISKTINLPEDIPFAEFEQVYLDAYDMGCKGCTTYRPNDVTGSIISVESEKKADMVKIEVTEEDGVRHYKRVPSEVIPLKRPDILRGNTYKAKWQGNNVYITINDYDDHGKTIPFEIFINSKEVGHFQWTTGLMRMISAIFRRGGDINFVIDELKQTFDPNGGAFYEGKYVPSMVALLGIILEKHLRGIGYNGNLPPMELKVEGPQLDIPALAPELAVKPAQCPQCKDFSLVANSGCPTCTSCGYSKCS